MSDWSQGYVTDIGYTQTFFRELTPRFMALAAILQGHRPPDVDRPFRYLELGCGKGLSLIASAIAHPQSSFVGVDFNPEHVASIRALARAVGLDNLEVLECDFEAFARQQPDRDPFDFVSLHGVFSWVSEENRGHVVDILNRGVAPGGLVFASYNTMPGWAALTPLQTLMRAHADLKVGRSDVRATEAIAFAQRLAALGTGYFAAHPGITQHLQAMTTQDGRYIAHEYLNAEWRPMAFTEVSSWMSRAKLGFVGSTSLPRNHDRFIMAAPAEAMLRELPDPAFAEYARDLVTNTLFRRDIWSRGTETLQAPAQERLLGGLSFLTLHPHAQAPTSFTVPIGEVRYPADLAAAMWSGLANGPVRFDRLAEGSSYGFADRSQYLSLLVQDGSAHVCAAPGAVGEQARRVAARTNALFTERAWEGLEPDFLIAPEVGSALHADVVDRMLLGYLTRPEATSVETIRQEISGAVLSRGSTMLKVKGETTSDPAAVAETLNARLSLEAIETRARLWRKAGILA